MRKISTLLVLALLYVMCNSVAAQNFTKEIQALSDSGSSIIRTIDRTHWLVYSENAKGHLFYLISVNDTVLSYMYFDDRTIKVTDFEIYSDTVYFCGSHKNNGVQCGIAGHFPIVGFPACTVKYDSFQEVLSFGALEAFSVEDHMHVVMTATAPTGYSTMTDLRHLSGDNWECDVVDSLGGWMFDDVAVSTTHILFTSRILPPSKVLSYVWKIDMPGYFGTVIFNSTINVDMFHGEPVCDTFLVTEAMGGFVMAKALSNGKIRMHQYAASTYSASLDFSGEPDFSLKALDYADVANCADVLVSTRNESGVDSRIYHVPAMAFVQNWTSWIYYYKNEDISLLCLSSDWDSTFVASGMDNASSCMRVYRYKYDNYRCTKQSGFEIEGVYPDVTYKDLGVSIKAYQHNIAEKTHNTGVVNIATICP